MSPRPENCQFSVTVEPESGPDWEWSGYADNTSDALLKALTVWEAKAANETVCPSCDGQGLMSPQATCRQCNGSGVYEQYAYGDPGIVL